jgi:transposase
MIQPSFIPPRPIRELCDLTRRRKRLLSHATAEKNRIQKILKDANVKLGNVLSDVFGMSGQLMLEALLKADCATGAGKRKEEDPRDSGRAGRTPDEQSSPAHDPL